MKYIILTLLLAISGQLLAGDCSYQIRMIDDLDDATAQQMIADCETKKLDKLQTKGNIDDWGDFALKFSDAIVQTAQKLGVTANEFLPTPVGKIAAVLIIWNVMGDSIIDGIRTVFGLLLAVVIAFVTRRIHKECIYSETKEFKVKGWFGREKVKLVKEYCNDLGEGQCVAIILSYVIAIIIAAVTIGNIGG